MNESNRPPGAAYTSRNLLLHAAIETKSAADRATDAAHSLENLPDKAGREWELTFLITNLELLSQQLSVFKDRIIRLVEE